MALPRAHFDAGHQFSRKDVTPPHSSVAHIKTPLTSHLGFSPPQLFHAPQHFRCGLPHYVFGKSLPALNGNSYLDSPSWLEEA
jgi:hypothetical protein